jgi:uncharacterized delta-60 repeat protein
VTMLGPNQPQAFTATVTGNSNSAVTWSLSNSVGSLSSSGAYTAPSTITTPATVDVIATSQVDNTTQGIATVGLLTVPVNSCASSTPKPGCLDSTFGTAGLVVTNAGGSGSSDSDFIHAIRQDSNGKLVSIGTSDGSPLALVVARYNSNGTLDSTFGSGGFSKFPINVVPSGGVSVNGLLDDSGNILVTGTAYTATQPVAFVLRFLANGTPDASFGSSGAVTLQNTVINSVAVQPDGKIVATGSSSVYRVDPNGSFDAGFGTNGTVQLAGVSNLQGIALQSVSGATDILVAGSMGANSSFGVMRLKSSGAVDSSFGTSGTALASPQSGGAAYSVALDSAGGIVADGSMSGVLGLVLARFTSSGTLDNTFGDLASGMHTGMTVADVGPSYLTGSTNAALTVDTNSANSLIYLGGTLVVNGSQVGSPTLTAPYLLRFDSSGALDLTFGEGGGIAVDFGGGPGSFAYATCLVVQSDRKVVEAGRATFASGPNNGANFALTRLWP